MRPTTVRGTPVRSISADNGQGFTNSGKPAGYSGTVPKAYEGDQSAKVNPKSGTPYNSSSKNDDKAPKTSSGWYGEVIDTQTGTNMNEPESNGNGVIFDGVTRAAGYRAGSQPQTLDSPVPEGAQLPVQDAPVVLANIRSGVGKAWGYGSGPGDNFQTMGGVMSRGMEEGDLGGRNSELVENKA